MASTQRLCSSVQHTFGTQLDGSWVETYIDKETGAVLFTQPIAAHRPTTTPPAQVGVEKGWCVMEAAAISHEIAQPVVPQSSPTDGLMVMGLAIGALLGIGGLGVALSYYIKPDPTLKLVPRKQQPLLPAIDEYQPEAVFDEPTDWHPESSVERELDTQQQWDDDDIELDDSADEKRLRDALQYPAVLIYGASGSGKSTLARWFIHERQQLGHTIEVCDPHRAYGQWEDVDHYGDGLDYHECDNRLKAFSDKVNDRYRTLASRPNYNPRPHTLLTEEFTNWASHCPHAGAFFSSSMSDLRKVNMHALYIAHARTLSALGGSSGTAKQRDNSLLEIELDVAINANGRPVPAGTGHIKYPQQKQRVPFKIPACVGAFADGKNFINDDTSDDDDELVDLLAKISDEIKKQASQKEGGNITVRAAAQCLPSAKRSEIYPQMPEICQQLAKMYPSEFKVFQGKAEEWRVAYLKSPTYNQ
ncbi:MAG: ATP-binding protein [Leptolyngbya sp. SIO3F4]|nr:ATP-binding protein [Leptolyngbya sp. SIO3F4]